MIIVMQAGATQAEIDRVIAEVDRLGFKSHPIYGAELTVIGIIGRRTAPIMEHLRTLPGVDRILPVEQPYKLVSRAGRLKPTAFRVGQVLFGGPELIVIAGPCAVESEEQLMTTARAVKEAGAHVLRGGAYKPRTSPHSFQGLGKPALELLAQARAETGLPVITEVTDPRNVELVSEYADILQVGARNMQNYVLLQEVGRARRPVVLKRGNSGTLEELLMAAEYIAMGGDDRILLCERGLRTFERQTRNTLDLSAVPVLKHLSHLPVAVDPSHAAGEWRLVPPLVWAAAAIGADAVMVEVHPNPREALSDGPQALTLPHFAQLMQQVRQLPRYSYEAEEEIDSERKELIERS